MGKVQCKVPRCSARCLLVPPGRPPGRPAHFRGCFSPKKVWVETPTIQSSVGACPRLDHLDDAWLWLSGRESRALRGLVGGWVGGWAPLFVFEGPRPPGCPLSTPGKVCPLVQRVGGLVEGGVQVLHMMGWSMEGLPECLGGWDPPSPWHPSGVDLVGTPQGVDGC